MQRKTSRWLALATLALAAVAGAAWWFTAGADPEFNGFEWTEPVPAPTFALRDANGDTFRLEDQRGRAVLLFFGYTHCPDVCPATMTLYHRLAERLGEEGEKVRLVFITVDPERDTPERLREYLGRYGDAVIGLTGEPSELQPVWDAYNVKTERIEQPDSALGYAVAHPSQIILVDPKGRIRLWYPFGFTAESVEQDIRLILREARRR